MRVSRAIFARRIGPSGLLAATLACATLCASWRAMAEEAVYDVVVDAPGDLKSIVEDNLSLIRWRDADGRRGRIDADQLRRLFDQGKGAPGIQRNDRPLATKPAQTGY